MTEHIQRDIQSFCEILENEKEASYESTFRTFSDIYQSFTVKRLEKYSKAFGDPKLCKLVVKVFGNAKGEPTLTSLLSVISILLGLKSNQDLFVKEKLIPSIVSLMRKNATSAQIQLLSCNVLMKFLPYKGNFLS